MLCYVMGPAICKHTRGAVTTVPPRVMGQTHEGRCDHPVLQPFMAEESHVAGHTITITMIGLCCGDRLARGRRSTNTDPRHSNIVDARQHRGCSTGPEEKKMLCYVMLWGLRFASTRGAL